MTAAQALIASLKAEGVSHMFGYAGATICPTVEALAQDDGDIGYTLVRTEQNAGHMASGYYRATGKVSVCMVTSGPGATNLITGIATAYMDSIPLVAITGQVPSHLLGKDIFQEVDISCSVSPFTKHTYLVKEASQIPRIVKEAFHIASTGRPGPVLIDLPVDVQEEDIGSFHYPETVQIRGYRPPVRGNDFQVKRVTQSIAKAKRPVLCLGGGVFLANARDKIRRFVEESGVPIVTTMMGLSLFPTDHPLNLGMVGSHGTATANKALAKADLLVLLGARVGDRAIVDPEIIGNRMEIIHIDIDSAEIGKNMEATIPLVGDISYIIDRMLENIPETTEENRDNVERYQQWRRSELDKHHQWATSIHPADFLQRFGKKLQDDAAVCVDVGQNQLFACKYLHLKENTRFLTSGGLGTMGYSLPCAVGLKVAQPERQTIVICGDGSFQMFFNELAAVKAGKMDIKIVLFQNNVLGLVHQIQRSSYTAPFGVDLDGSPDFLKIADAYDIPARTLFSTDSEVIDQTIDEFLALDSAAILVVSVDSHITTTS